VFLQWELVSLRVTGFMVNMITLTIRTLFAFLLMVNKHVVSFTVCSNRQ